MSIKLHLCNPDDALGVAFGPPCVVDKRGRVVRGWRLRLLQMRNAVASLVRERRTQRVRVGAVDTRAGVITLVAERWSWRRWRWERMS